MVLLKLILLLLQLFVTSVTNVVAEADSAVARIKVVLDIVAADSSFAVFYRLVVLVMLSLSLFCYCC